MAEQTHPIRQPADDNWWLSTADAAQLVPCHPNTIRAAIHRGKLRSRRVGLKLLYVHLADVCEFFNLPAVTR